MVEIAEQVIKAAKALQAEDIPIIAGGFITEKDRPLLEKMGVTGNFTSGTPHEVIVDHVMQVAGLNEQS